MTAHACLFSQGPIRGKTILVSGGGGAVGNMAIQLGCWAGARVLATAGNEASLNHAREAGADHTINYGDADFSARVLQATGGRGVDLIVEVDLGANLKRAVEILCMGGTVAAYASSSEREPRIPFYPWAAKNIQLRCVLVYELSPAQRAHATADIYNWCSSGSPRIVIAEAFPLDKIALAHERVEAGKKIGHVVVDL